MSSASFIALCLMLTSQVPVSEGTTSTAAPANPLQVIVNQLTSEVAQLQVLLEAQRQQIAALKEARGNARTVAFTAYIAEADGLTVNASTDALIPFHSVITNVGNAFNTTAAAFVAPVSGLYYFVVSVDCSHDYKNGLHVVKNGVTRVLDADKDETHTNHIDAEALLVLDAGDTITCIHADHLGYLATGLRSVIVGFLVK